MNVSPGQPLKFGKYELLTRIAAGGMAELYRARISGEAGFTKIIAIKKILPHLLTETELITAFVDEARLAAMLDHPNIIQLHDFGREEGDYFIAMELLQGCDLGSVLRHLKTSGQRLPLNLALFISAKVCAGLEYAHNLHDHGGQPLHIVHRDITPANIFLTDNGVVKIIDFGIARAASHNRATMAGSMMGKVRYMAPEQAAGQKIDYRVDIYALGAVLYEALAGRALFSGEMLQVLEKVRAGAHDPPEEVIEELPPAVAALINKALRPDPADRYQSCEAMLDDMELCLGQCSEPANGRVLARWLSGQKVAGSPGAAEAGLAAGEETVANHGTGQGEQTVVAPSGPAAVEATIAMPAPASSRGDKVLVPLLDKGRVWWRDNRLLGGSILAVLLISLLFTLVGFSRDYTAHNIWLHDSERMMRCINYKSGATFLPAGSRVKDLKVNEAENSISFKTVAGKKLAFQFTPDWHPGKTVNDYAEMMVGSKTFRRLSKGMGRRDVAAIKEGRVVTGMSKEAVLLAYGFPPEHVTKSLAANRWVYWRNRHSREPLCFDDSERLLASCPKQQGQGLFDKLEKLLD
ncbi:MAG: serine/threonine-protein kinase [Thermodesulfobacteriota bacterium]